MAIMRLVIQRVSEARVLIRTIALPLYNQFIKELRQEIEVQTGQFGEHMQVSLINQGPVTLILESEKKCSKN